MIPRGIYIMLPWADN